MLFCIVVMYNLSHKVMQTSHISVCPNIKTLEVTSSSTLNFEFAKVLSLVHTQIFANIIHTHYVTEIKVHSLIYLIIIS
jgi:hypothetical protein